MGRVSPTCIAAPPPMWTRYFTGQNPGDLPVEHPTKFEFVINLKPLRPSVSSAATLLGRADEVIE